MIKAIVYHNVEQIKTYEFKKSSVTGRLSKNQIEGEIFANTVFTFKMKNY